MMATLETLLEDEENQIRGMTYIIVGKGTVRMPKIFLQT